MIFQERYFSKQLLSFSEHPFKDPEVLLMQSISKICLIVMVSYWESTIISGKLRQQYDYLMPKHRHYSPSFWRVQRMKGLSSSQFTNLARFAKATQYSFLPDLKLRQLVGSESKINENLATCFQLRIMLSQKYRDQIKAPIAPYPLPANTILSKDDILNLFELINYKCDFMILFPRKQKSFPLYLVAQDAYPWNKLPSQLGIITLPHDAQAGSDKIPEVIDSWLGQNDETQVCTEMQLSKEADKELPPQKIGVGVGIKYTIMPLVELLGETYRKLCEPLRQRAFESKLLISLSNIIDSVMMKKPRTIRNLDIIIILQIIPSIRESKITEQQTKTSSTNLLQSHQVYLKGHSTSHVKDIQ